MNLKRLCELLIFIELNFKGLSLASKQLNLSEVLPLIAFIFFPYVKRDRSIVTPENLFYHFLCVNIFIIQYLQRYRGFFDLDSEPRVLLAYQL